MSKISIALAALELLAEGVERPIRARLSRWRGGMMPHGLHRTAGSWRP